MIPLEPFILFWSALFGGVVGSFLNVVIHRLPLGKSLSKPGSQCPKCGHAIRWHDNIPVFGWGILGGKCRDCKEPISLRYPFIEALTAAMFCAVAAVFLYTQPMENPWLPWRPVTDWTIEMKIGVATLQLTLLTLALTIGMIEYDGRKPPKVLCWSAGIVLLALVLTGTVIMLPVVGIAIVIYAAIWFVSRRSLAFLSLWAGFMLQILWALGQ